MSLKNCGGINGIVSKGIKSKIANLVFIHATFCIQNVSGTWTWLLNAATILVNSLGKKNMCPRKAAIKGDLSLHLTERWDVGATDTPSEVFNSFVVLQFWRTGCCTTYRTRLIQRIEIIVEKGEWKFVWIGKNTSLLNRDWSFYAL